MYGRPFSCWTMVCALFSKGFKVRKICYLFD
jgi:hypothetical protein